MRIVVAQIRVEREIAKNRETICSLLQGAVPGDPHQRVVKARDLGARGADGEQERERVERRFLHLDVEALEQRARQLGAPLTGHADAVSSVAFSPDSRALAVAFTVRKNKTFLVAEHPLDGPGPPAETEVLFSDLSHEYVTINAEYTT